MATENKNLTLEIAVIQNEIKNIKESNSNEHNEIKVVLSSLNAKFDEAIKRKADRDDLKILDSRTWSMVIGMLMLLLGIIASWFKNK